MVIPLRDLEQGQKAQIVWMALPPVQECQLNDLGLDADRWVTCLQKGRGGGMSAYLIGHRVIALRVPEASKILVKLPSDRPDGDSPTAPDGPEQELRGRAGWR